MSMKALNAVTITGVQYIFKAKSSYSIGIHAIGNFQRERFPHKDLALFKLVRHIHGIDRQVAAWFESDFVVSCGSYIATFDNGIFAYTFLLIWLNMIKA